MTKTTVAQLPAKLYEILSPLSAEDRNRVVQATLILLGDDATPATPASGGLPSLGARATGSTPTDAGAYFDDKAPKNKGEALAVAARFRELRQNKDTHSKADLKAVITGSRRNFDDHNFARDINNAKRQAGFFNLGTGRDASKLSYYGQRFVEALPDRETAAKLKRPKVGGNRKQAAKKTSAKAKGGK